MVRKIVMAPFQGEGILWLDDTLIATPANGNAAPSKNHQRKPTLLAPQTPLS